MGKFKVVAQLTDHSTVELVNSEFKSNDEALKYAVSLNTKDVIELTALEVKEYLVTGETNGRKRWTIVEATTSAEAWRKAEKIIDPQMWDLGVDSYTMSVTLRRD
ncbi:hypothetical protein [Bacillus atrophaeus]|uniref:hypothetical protein n=1 Tax=Bacillus atrophaeus TaxID=1452 RepID=UPI002DBFDCCB|nr:hypothetical protein [Bacillus atrophaeus]MEC2307641.1 hypothetical protein [Bacillus atrophaeus]